MAAHMRFALSTNWNNVRLDEGAAIADEALALGFDALELGFRTQPEQIAGFKSRLDRMPVDSVHAYCPVPLGAPSGHPELHRLASRDADERALARILLKKTLACAADLGAKTVVTHAGYVDLDGWFVNLDSEDEGQIFVSCAGGCRTFAQFDYTEEALPAGFFTFSLAIKGLTGGHSGDDIEKKRANANKLLARFLYLSQQKYDLRLIDIQAGGLHNAIPREAWCLCAVPMKDKESITVDWNLYQADVEEEYSVTEKTMVFTLQSETAATAAIDKDCSQRLIKALQGVDNGVYAYCQDLDLIETSSNLASIHKMPEAKTIDVNSSQRSSIYSARVNMANTFAAVFELAGARVDIGEGYPGWKMNPNSEILRIAVEQYKKLFKKEPIVRGIHAGLECGLFSEKFPGMDMISMGPTLRGVHSPDEKLLIPTVQMVWDHLLAILKEAPERGK